MQRQLLVWRPGRPETCTVEMALSAGRIPVSPPNLSGDPLLDNAVVPFDATGVIETSSSRPPARHWPARTPPCHQPASIGDFVFDDANVNGRPGCRGRTGIAGVTVHLQMNGRHGASHGDAAGRHR